jgi:hypothetical protein
VEVLESPAVTTLPRYAQWLLLIFCAQYYGSNNGNLAVTPETAKRHGIHSKKQLVVGIRLLLARGLIQKTYQGGKKPIGPCLYAVTWRRLNDVPKAGIKATLSASNDWVSWTPLIINGSPGGT